MAGSAKVPRYASAQLSSRMRQAGEQLALDFRKASEVHHAATTGTAREDSVRRFLETQLPDGYAVTAGFSFDALDAQSKQMDVLIYRRRDAPFVLTDSPVLVPCESLLAAIEIKSELSSEELKDSFGKANSIRSLKPFGRDFSDARMRGAAANDLRPRCFFTIFAYETDLAKGDDWLTREGARFKRVADELSVPPQYVDRLIVLDRGVINSAHGRGHDSARGNQVALQIWFVHLLNHLLREDRRRPEIDIDIYTGGDRWMALPGWKALRARPALQGTRNDATSSRNRTRQPRKRH